MKNDEQSSSQTNNEFQNRFDVKTVSIVVVLFLIAVAFILWNPVIDNGYHQERAVTLTAQLLTEIRPVSQSTPIPAQYLDYPSQTNGIILGSVFIVLIIFGGTLSVIQHRK